MLASEPLLGNPFPPFPAGANFPTWEFFSELFSPNPLDSTCSYDEQTLNPITPNSGSDDPNITVPVINDNDRKKRRMISNRESARRSRMRKQKHLENLRNQVNRLKILNRELSNRLSHVTVQYHRITTDNDRLLTENSTLRQKVSEIHQVLLFQQLQQSAWPCNSGTYVAAGQTPSSLIT